jgi:predicted esterase
VGAQEAEEALADAGNVGVRASLGAEPFRRSRTAGGARDGLPAVVAERDAALAEAHLPVFWGRDPHDPVITDELVAYTRRWLPEHSHLDARLYSNVGHGISMEEVDDVREFLTAVTLV